ncbi:MULTISPECIES: phosphoenolpyruvate carboxykinase (ATP) [Paenibacillus]|uniref:aldolase n=1 Tax=Paenibacillus TaxID=44249 RepID=UPI00048F77D8|nr:aldolase [Paenibacillus sp. IHBB 10380]
MLHTIKSIAYKAFGLTIHSDIPLPELQPAPNLGASADITVSYADLKEAWLEESSAANASFVCTANRVMFRVPELAIFAIENGTLISVFPEKSGAEDRIRLYVLGSCMGAILLQRRILPLHGSAIVVNHKAYAFVGHSGHGKSTLASALLQRGYRLLTDDVIAVTLDEQNTPLVTPAYPQQKLWQESLDVFGMNSVDYRPLADRETKYAIPVVEQFSNAKVPLAGVFELVKSNCDKVRIQPIDRLGRLPLLYLHTYRNLLLSGSGLTDWHFDFTARLSGHIDVYRLERPLNESTVHELAELVLTTIGADNDR